jgi:hypothetical protein
MPRIWLATIIDLPFIRLLWKAMAEEVATHESYPARILNSLDDFTRSAALALTAQPPVVFFFLGQTPDSPDPDILCVYEVQHRAIGEPLKIAYIHYLYVAPPARHRGITSLLSPIVGEHMLAQGLQVVEITTPIGRNWWTDLGMTPYEQRCWIPIARGMVGLEERTKRAMLATANGLDPDPDSVPPPVDLPEPTAEKE